MNTNIRGKEKGIIIHNIIEKINNWYAEDNINEEYIINIISSYSEPIDNETQQDHLNMLENIKMLVNSSLFQRYKNYFSAAKFEYEIHLPFENNYLYGIIDCLIKNKDDIYEIWDWKTNNVNNINELREQYYLQMLLYIYLLMHLYPEQDKFIARIISTELIKKETEEEKWVFSIEKSRTEIKNIEHEIQKIVNNTLIQVEN